MATQVQLENSHLNNAQVWLVGWEISIPFQHKNRLYRGQGLG